eukprot:jgi/Bigna1/145376/aug1.98_g20084
MKSLAIKLGKENYKKMALAEDELPIAILVNSNIRSQRTTHFLLATAASSGFILVSTRRVFHFLNGDFVSIPMSSILPSECAIKSSSEGLSSTWVSIALKLGTKLEKTTRDCKISDDCVNFEFAALNTAKTFLKIIRSLPVHSVAGRQRGYGVARRERALMALKKFNNIPTYKVTSLNHKTAHSSPIISSKARINLDEDSDVPSRASSDNGLFSPSGSIRGFRRSADSPPGSWRIPSKQDAPSRKGNRMKILNLSRSLKHKHSRKLSGPPPRLPPSIARMPSMSGILEAEALAACAALDFETSSEDEESTRAFRNHKAGHTMKRKNDDGISDRKMPIRSKSTLQLLEGGEWKFSSTTHNLLYRQKPIPVLGEHSMVFNREDKTNKTWTEVRIVRDTSELNSHDQKCFRFYMDPSQNRIGPLDEEQMRHKFWEGEIDLRSFVWNRTMDRYARLEDTPLASHFKEFRRLPDIPTYDEDEESRPITPPSPPPPPPRSDTEGSSSNPFTSHSPF